MNVKLTKKITLKSAIVYLKLQKKVKREDIQNYLQGKSFNNPIVEDRVREYLKNAGIYNEQYNLTTPYGYEVRDKGMFKENEEGKYQIWFIQDDFLFDNRIFYFKRIKPEPYSQEPVQFNLNLTGKNFCSLPIKGEEEQDSIEFSVIDEINTIEKKMISEISFVWTWNDTKSSSFKFSGNFETLPIDANKSVDFQIDLKKHIPAVIPDWNNDTERCKIKIENINNDVKKDDIYKYFEYTGIRAREGYDLCEFIKLPVEPYNYEEAVIWREKIINIELEKKYIHPDDFTDRIIMINQKEGFTAYYDHLDVPTDMKCYIEKLEPGKKSDRGSAYWHLTAPLDLNVDIPQSLKIDHLSLIKGENISFGELTAKFNKIMADKIFYYDKYVQNYYQQRSVSAFLSCFGVKDICIITETNNPDNKFDKYLTEKKPEITVNNISEVYQNKADAPHDRYIVFKSGGDLIVWTSTNSIGFIRFNKNGEITPDTPGTILKSVTFTKVKPDVLGTRLKEFILRG